jgi:molybdate transport system regulatory protein
MAKKILQPGAAAVRPRIYLGPTLSLGPGKIDLLRAVSETGSISAAARDIGMSYKRAWFLIDTLNRGFGEPVVEALAGGNGGGGTRLTPLGEAVVRHYLRMEANCRVAVRPDIIALRRLLARHAR